MFFFGGRPRRLSASIEGRLRAFDEVEYCEALSSSELESSSVIGAFGRFIAGRFFFDALFGCGTSIFSSESDKLDNGCVGSVLRNSNADSMSFAEHFKEVFGDFSLLGGGIGETRS